MLNSLKGIKNLTDLTINFWPNFRLILTVFQIFILQNKNYTKQMTSPKASLTLQFSPAHQSSINKSQAMSSKVTQFLKNSIQMPMESSQKMSSSSLSNSNTFLKSEIDYLISLVEQTNKRYQQRELQLAEQKKKIKDYEGKISQLQKTQLKQAETKCNEDFSTWKNQEIFEKQSKGEQAKTRKKADQIRENSNQGLVRPINSETSSFQFTVSNKNNVKYELDSSSISIKKLQNELKCAEKLNQFWKQKYQDSSERIIGLLKDLQQTKEKQFLNQNQLEKIISQKNRLQIDYNFLKSNYQNLETQYNLTQEKFGKEIGQYKILVENLRQVLRNLQKTKSPKRMSNKEKEGYYSINKKMKQSGQSFSSESDTSSLKSSISGHLQRNLKEENELLRTQLIKAFDQKGLMKSQLKKYQKMVDRLTKQKSQLKKSQSFTDQNNRSSINQKTQEIDDSFASKIFKKNKASMILVVENTESKQREIMEKHKLSSLLKQLKKIIYELAENKSQEMFEILQARPQVFQDFIKNLKNCYIKQSEIIAQLNKAKQQNQLLRKQKKEIEDKSKKDIAQIQSFLHEISQNKSNIKSQDSTDQAFKNIKLQNQIQQCNQSFVQKERQYIEKIEDQEKQIVALKNRILAMEQANESFYKLTSQNPSSFNNPSNSPNQLVPHLHVMKQENMVNTFENQVLQLSSFEMFKQKLTEFYQHTIKELQDWQVSALRNLNPSVNYVPQIKSQIFKPSYRIPQIVERNILKISRQFKSIKGTEEQNTPRSQVQGCENEFFVNQKMSRSFTQEDKKSQTLQDIINKRLVDFHQFSSEWIQKVVGSPVKNQKDDDSSEKVQDETIKQQVVECQSSKRMNMAMTQRPAVEKSKKFQIDMNDIDANSESVTSQELIRERQLFIRQEYSYFLPRNDSLNNVMKSANSKKSFHSIRF